MEHWKGLSYIAVPAMLLCAFVNACSSGDAGGVSGYPRIKGPPHQRLKWKAEDFFTDRSVIGLCKAIEAKDLKEIERLVKSGVDVNAKGRGSMTPLLWAFPMGESVFEQLLRLGADPNTKLTARVWAACFREGASVTSASASAELLDGPIHDQYFYDAPMDNYLKLVLEHGGNPNIEDGNGDTPLLCLRYSDRGKALERIRLLLDAGADINHRNKRGETVLVKCIASYYFALDLLKCGADYRVANNEGWDAILCLESGRRFVEERRSGRDDQWTDSLLRASQPVFEWLSEAGVNWGAAGEALNTPKIRNNLKDLPADYEHRPWLPHRPTLKNVDE